MKTNYIGQGRTTVYSLYRCAENTAGSCASTVSPYYHLSGSVFSGDDLSCQDGYLYRCASSTDQCNWGSTSVDAAQSTNSFSAKRCYCNAGGTSCGWSYTAVTESGTASSTVCTDGIDNDCDGLTDLDDGGCCVSDFQSGCTQNSDCCNYQQANPTKGFLCYSGMCIDSANCMDDGYQLCWNNFCIDQGNNRACCRISGGCGTPPLDCGEWKSISTY